MKQSNKIFCASVFSGPSIDFDLPEPLDELDEVPPRFDLDAGRPCAVLTAARKLEKGD